jgi:hypothetical protein
MKSLIVAIVMAFSLTVSAADTCFPKNSLSYPTSLKSASMTKVEFDESIERVKAVYAPIFKEQYGAELVIENNWEDETVNAYASQSGKTWMVAMFGGLARAPQTTRDGFEAVICHEIGHHVGGAVKYPLAMANNWASSEGQSDYFATSKCLKKVFAADLAKTLEVFERTNLTKGEEFAKAQCESVYKSESEQAICFRTALAGQSLAKLLGSLGGNEKVDFLTPDPKVVKRTVHSHPQGQCRMDTYFQGGLCDKADSIFPDNKDVSVGFCTKKEGYAVGLRPACWYNASEYEK